MTNAHEITLPPEHDVVLPPFTVAPTVVAQGESVDWGLALAGVPDAWKDTEGEGVTVAVLDNGCDVNHQDLQGAIADTRDFTGRGFSPGDHGTPCCGIIGARKNNSGIIGCAPKSRIIVGKVLHGMSGDFRWTGLGIRWAANAAPGCIISMSLGGPYPDPSVLEAIEYALEQGCFIVAAAGNDGRDNSVNYPAKWADVLAIGAVKNDGTLARFSSRGPEVDLVAPGEGITSTSPGGGHSIYDGTSFACPFVAGVAALIVAKHRKSGGGTPVTNQAQLIAHLVRTAKDIGPPGHDHGTGWGLVQVKGILESPTPWESPWFGLPFTPYEAKLRKKVA